MISYGAKYAKGAILSRKKYLIEPNFVDLTQCCESEKTQYLNEARHQMATQGVPTDSWPLFDINIIRIDEDTHLLHLIVDLVVADGRSLNLLFQQWQDLYHEPTSKLDTPAIAISQYLENKPSRALIKNSSKPNNTGWIDCRLTPHPSSCRNKRRRIGPRCLYSPFFSGSLNQLQRGAFSHNVLPLWQCLPYSV